MQIILPDEATGRKLDTICLLHPSAKKPARFLVDLADDAPHSVYELTKVGSDSRSAIIDDTVESDGSVVIASPIQPIFLILGVLYAQRNKPLPLDTILELSAGERTQNIPEKIIASHIDSVCKRPAPNLYALDTDKLKPMLDKCVNRVRGNVPPMIANEILGAIRPLMPNQQITPELKDDAELYSAVSLVATTWMDDDTSDWYLHTFDFKALAAAAERLRQIQDVMESMQFASGGGATKRGAPERKQDSKKPKTGGARNNLSILDMFKRPQ